MPIYEYLCENCKNKFAILIRSSKDERIAVCPNCGSRELRKLFSSFATGGTKESGASEGSCSCAGPC